MTNKKQKTTNFGFKTIPINEKVSHVEEVFSKVANKYDLMNDLMSLGIHRYWKNEMINWLRPQPEWKIIDVAGGTGDIAIRINKKFSKNPRNIGSITVCDINKNMVKKGRDKTIDNGIISGIEWTITDAESLPFKDMTFDAYTVSFGLRNVTDIKNALNEARRVLKPGGRFLCLEFNKSLNIKLQSLYDSYSFNILPKLGKIVVGEEEAYKYLSESIRLFPSQKQFISLMQESGLSLLNLRNFSGGIVCIYSGWRI